MLDRGMGEGVRGIAVRDLGNDLEVEQRVLALEQELVDQRASKLPALLLRGQRRGRGMLRARRVHDHELAVRRQLPCSPTRRAARALGAVVADHEAPRRGAHVELVSRSRASRYGARYLAAILVGGDQVG